MLYDKNLKKLDTEICKFQKHVTLTYVVIAMIGVWFGNLTILAGALLVNSRLFAYDFDVESEFSRQYKPLTLQS